MQSQTATAAQLEELKDIDLLLVYEEFTTHLQRKRNNTQKKQQQPTPTHNRTEECTPDCQLFHSSLSDSVYFCNTSGRMHYCTTHSCDALDIYSSYKTCRVTGNTYPLDAFVISSYTNIQGVANSSSSETSVDYDDTRDDSVGGMAQLLHFMECSSNLPVMDPHREEEEEQNKKDTKKKKKKKKRKSQIEHDEDQTTNASSSSSVKGGPKKKAMLWALTNCSASQPMSTDGNSKKLRTEALYSEARTFLLSLSPILAQTPNLLHGVANLSVAFWHAASHTKIFEQLKSRYRFRNHVAAFAYNCVEGIGCDGDYLIPPMPDLKLPSADALKTVDMKKSAYTKTCHDLLMLARELLLNKISFC